MRVTTRPGVLALVAAVCLLAACAEPAPPTPLIGQLDVSTRIQEGEPPLMLDVRTAQEYAAGHVPGAINIPHTELKARAGELAAYQRVELVIYCEEGSRTRLAAATLRKQGFERLFHLEGDLAAWRAKGLPIAGES